ncbi:2OG-Fe(II) oxygenase family protein [Methylobacterium nodulans]|uniref:Prolyl 4-hydroxylase alpha subunit n=1 Tax=Methylobacterium nodulans (strain LMG 21967 / CNCM I-2342 / ORS 2060) TaxID=460265 RepID=B8IDX8_METNO|nr:2OG-Fe(II) oxygenase [Methylobacterium nodulans]ACL55700.1 Prolyl 4-hydroxylase alpha subunit [Methylobacterium nodulans ORS 2060]
MSGLSILNVDAVRAAPLSREPYSYILGEGVLRPEAVDDLRRDFPDIAKPGYLTVDEVQLKGRFKDLIEELESDAFSAVMSEKFGIDLVSCPRLTTIMKRSQPKYGAIHTDGPSKVMTLLVYMNDAWEAPAGGRLRVLYDGQNFEPYAVEVPPTMGTLFAFLRADNSWHGHRPFEGERRVVQVAWVRDAAELERKKKRNRTAQFLKGIFGR